METPDDSRTTAAKRLTRTFFALVGVFILYVFSEGPAYLLAVTKSRYLPAGWLLIYEPLWSLARQTSTDELLQEYENWWLVWGKSKIGPNE